MTDLRDGGHFASVAVCPWCSATDVHPLRASNPAIPTPPSPLALRIEMMRIYVSDGEPTPPRGQWDERRYESVRTCKQCGHEWGQK